MRRLTLLASLAMTSPLTLADGFALYGGGYSWDAKLDGSISSDGGLNIGDIDVQDDLGFDRADQSVLYLGLEHPVPLIPNVRLRSMDISDQSSSRVQRSFVYDGQPFTVGTRVNSDLQLTMTDGTAYYSLLDNAVKLNLGLTVRQAEADLTLVSALGQASESLDQTLPLLHASGRLKLPLTGLYAGGEVNTTSFEGWQLTDYNAYLGWVSPIRLGVEVGYGQLEFTLDDVSDVDADLSLGGPYMALLISL